jgi:dynein heavy chain
MDMAKEIQGRLPKQINLKKKSDISFAITSKGVLNSLGVFLLQEVDRFNKLLSVMNKSLTLLQQAIQGTTVMSMELEAMFNCFLDNKVPKNWINSAYPCLKPLATWEEDMIKRIEFMSDWFYNGPPVSFWLPCFFFPQGFMTAALQEYSRSNDIALYTLKFRTNIMKAITP